MNAESTVVHLSERDAAHANLPQDWYLFGTPEDVTAGLPPGHAKYEFRNEDGRNALIPAWDYADATAKLRLMVGRIGRARIWPPPDMYKGVAGTWKTLLADSVPPVEDTGGANPSGDPELASRR